MAYMDYKDLAVRCHQKGNLIAHSLQSISNQYKDTILPT